MPTAPARVLQRRQFQRTDTATGWQTANPILGTGEIGFVSDQNTFKIGDGTTPWNSLPYPDNPTITAALQTLTALITEQETSITNLVTHAQLGDLSDFLSGLNGT